MGGVLCPVGIVVGDSGSVGSGGAGIDETGSGGRLVVGSGVRPGLVGVVGVTAGVAEGSGMVGPGVGVRATGWAVTGIPGSEARVSGVGVAGSGITASRGGALGACPPKLSFESWVGCEGTTSGGRVGPTLGVSGKGLAGVGVATPGIAGVATKPPSVAMVGERSFSTVFSREDRVCSAASITDSAVFLRELVS